MLWLGYALKEFLHLARFGTLTNYPSASNLKCNTYQEVMCCDGNELQTLEHGRARDDPDGA